MDFHRGTLDQVGGVRSASALASPVFSVMTMDTSCSEPT